MKGSLGEVALKRLRDDILNMTLLPRETLSERKLSEQLRLSRTPVREALKALEHEGLVYRANRSFEVSPINIGEINAAFDFRLVIERAAVRLAGPSIHKQQVDSLSESLPHIDTLLTNIDDQIRQGEKFHIMLVKATGNRFLIQSLTQLLPLLVRARLLEASRPGGVQQAGVEHAAIWQFLQEGEMERADNLICNHIERSRMRLTESLRALDCALRFRGVVLEQ